MSDKALSRFHFFQRNFDKASAIARRQMENDRKIRSSRLVSPY
jgi:hypothetical protein